MVSFSQTSEKLRFYNLVQNLTVANPDFKAHSSNTVPGWTVRFFGGDDLDILKEGVETYLLAPISPLNSPTFCSSAHL